MKKLALIYLVPEGVNTWVAGVGSVINANMRALPLVAEDMKKLGYELNVYFATPAATPAVRGWNPEQLEKARKVSSKLGGKVVLLPNYTDGSDNFGRLESWKAISGAGAGLSLELATQYDKTVVLAHSSHPFALAPVYIDMQHDALGVDITSVYTIHSTAIQDRTFQFKGKKHPDHERIMVEALAIQWSKFTDTIRLGCISDYMGEHLVKEHGARRESLIPIKNGIDKSDPHFALISEDRKLAKLKEFGIPLDKQLFFSWGRFVSEKGFDIVLESAAKTKGAVHPVIVGMVDHSPEYPDEIIKMSKDLNIDCTIIVERDWELVTSILQWKNTALVAILSRYDEPHGLTVNEARYHARNGGPLVMVSNRGGLPEQIEHGKDGFIANIDDPDGVVNVIDEFLAMDQEKRETIRQNALKILDDKFSFRKNIVEMLVHAIPCK